MSKIEARLSRFGRAGTMLLAGVLVGCGSDVKPTQRPIYWPPAPSGNGQTFSPETAQITPLPRETLTPGQIILGEIQRRANEFREEDKRFEQNLWRGSYEYSPGLSESLNATDGIFLTISRAKDTLDLMAQSRNPFFQGTEITFRLLRDDRRLEITAGVLENPDDPNRPQTPAFTVEGEFTDDGKFIITLVIWEKFALDESNALLMANALTHAAITASELDTRAGQIIRENPQLSKEEKEQALLRYINDDRLRIEARGFGEEAQAMIFQVGLLDGRIYTVPESGSEERAANFITLGGTNSETWTDYIEEILFEFPGNTQTS